jgi:hypothetical protein
MKSNPMLVSDIAAAAEPNPTMFFLWKWVANPRELPTLHLEADCLRVGTQSLSLQGKKLVQDLVSLFLDAPSQQVQRGELVAQLYSPLPPSMLSWRQRECYHHNTVKLISRTRKLLRAAFPLGTQWEWLPYDAHSQTWSLYRLRFSPSSPPS